MCAVCCVAALDEPLLLSFTLPECAAFMLPEFAACTLPEFAALTLPEWAPLSGAPDSDCAVEPESVAEVANDNDSCDARSSSAGSILKGLVGMKGLLGSCTLSCAAIPDDSRSFLAADFRVLQPLSGGLFSGRVAFGTCRMNLGSSALCCRRSVDQWRQPGATTLSCGEGGGGAAVEDAEDVVSSSDGR